MNQHLGQLSSLALCGLMPIMSLCLATEPLPALRNGRLGYSDLDGTIVIPCNLDPVFPGAWGSLAPSVDPQDFEFREGLAIVADGNKCGAIDIHGKWAFPERYDHIGQFSNGVAIAHADSRAGYLGRDGKWLVTPQFSECLPFSEGLAAVSREDSSADLDRANVTNHWGFIDLKGKLQIPTRFAAVRSFHEGVAAASESASGKWGFIDKNGDWAVRPKFNRVVASYADGLAIARNDNRDFFVDHSGAEVDLGDFYRVKEFSEGLAAFTVFTPLGLRVGFIDRKGKVVVEPRYLASGNFAEGMCAVRLPSGWAYIDRTGKIVLRSRRVFSAGTFNQGVTTLMISTQRRAFLFRDGKLLVEDGNDRDLETPTLDNDAIGIVEDELVTKLTESEWLVDLREFSLSELQSEVVGKLPPLAKTATLKRLIGEHAGIVGTWWLTIDPESGKFRVFYNHFLHRKLM